MDSNILPNPRIHWVLKKRNIAIYKGNTVAVLSLRYRCFAENLGSFDSKGLQPDFEADMANIALFRPLTDFRIIDLDSPRDRHVRPQEDVRVCAIRAKYRAMNLSPRTGRKGCQSTSVVPMPGSMPFGICQI